ncbi:MAG TPA: hypothetical protein VFV73_12620 [Streptosporangiaceae bacterium]|nr:hypothetical protein [Streptosporangiaceae bacterium]
MPRKLHLAVAVYSVGEADPLADRDAIARLSSLALSPGGTAGASVPQAILTPAAMAVVGHHLEGS